MRVLNLYAGIGGNRLLWDNVDVVAVEQDSSIAKAYSENFPNDTIVVGDAHQYLLDNFSAFDFIWSSPPCQSHSRFTRSGRNRTPRYPSMSLYEEIIFLKHNAKCPWVVENVKPYYGELIEARKIGRHLFWANYQIPSGHVVPKFKNMMNRQNIVEAEQMKAWLGIQYEGSIYVSGNHCPTQVLRNCVHPKTGLFVFNAGAGRTLETQHTLFA